MNLISAYEVAVVNALRVRPWLWLRLDEVWRDARRWHPVKRRQVRHHLQRFERLGLVETTDQLDPYPGMFYSWSTNANAAAVVVLDRAAQAEGLLLAPLGIEPRHCPHGHAYAEHGYRWPEGALACIACGEAVIERGHAYPAAGLIHEHVG